MTEWDRLVARALDALAAELPRLGFSGGEASTLLPAIGAMNFPGTMALVAAGAGSDAELGRTLLHRVSIELAATQPLQRAHLDAGSIERSLTAILRHSARPDDVLQDAAVRDVLLNAAVELLARQSGIPVTGSDVTAAAGLISTGQVFTDLASALAGVAFAVRSLPIRLIDDASSLPERVGPLLLAIVKDLAGTSLAPLTVLTDILADGTLDHPPGVMTHTFRCLLRFSSLASTSRVIADLLGNRTVRLTILVYARSQGIPLEEADMDALRENVFLSAAPDLGPLFVRAAERFLDRGGSKAQLLDVARRLAASS